MLPQLLGLVKSWRHVLIILYAIRMTGLIYSNISWFVQAIINKFKISRMGFYVSLPLVLCPYPFPSLAFCTYPWTFTLILAPCPSATISSALTTKILVSYIDTSVTEFSAFYFLKSVSAIFYQIFIFSPNDSLSKTMKSVF